MKNSKFNTRIEKKYQVGITEGRVAELWRFLNGFLRPYSLVPVQDITSVGSVYFDNRSCDLLRYSLLGRLFIVRVRAYERYGRPPEPLSEYWVEVKTAAGDLRKKKRFLLTKRGLVEFLEGKESGESLFGSNGNGAARNGAYELYRETQETVFTMGLKPVLLVACKRIAFQSSSERLSIDWDIKYYPVSANVFDYDSWKDLVEEPAGKADKVIMEIKSLRGGVPEWLSELQLRYPIRRREYLKPVEGMGFLFHGPLGYHEEAKTLSAMIESYMINSESP